MKTEIVIDDLLAMRLKEVADASHITFTQAVQNAISAGLPHLPPKTVQKPFKAKTHNFGTALDDPKAVLAALEESDDIERYRRAGG